MSLSDNPEGLALNDDLSVKSDEIPLKNDDKIDWVIEVPFQSKLTRQENYIDDYRSKFARKDEVLWRYIKEITRFFDKLDRKNNFNAKILE